MGAEQARMLVAGLAIFNGQSGVATVWPEFETSTTTGGRADQ